jgi:hypothetical protein
MCKDDLADGMAAKLAIVHSGGVNGPLVTMNSCEE